MKIAVPPYELLAKEFIAERYHFINALPVFCFCERSKTLPQMAAERLEVRSIQRVVNDLRCSDLPTAFTPSSDASFHVTI